MQTTVILISGAILTLLIFNFWRTRQQREWGFMDLIKNPELWGELIAGPDETDRKVTEARSWSDEKIAKEVENYLFKSKRRRDSWSIARALENLGPRAHPHVLRILADKSRHQQLLTPTYPGNNDSLAETPFERACQILDNNPPSEALTSLALFLDAENKQVRKHAALTIASTGAQEMIPLARKALKDQDSFVRSYVLMGFDRAIKNKCLGARCQQELFDDVEQLMDGEHYADSAARLLFKFDAVKAKSLFLADATFAADAKKLKSVLKVLADNNVEVPRERLQKIIAETDVKNIKYPETYKLAEALRLLGSHKNTNDLPCLESFLLHSEKDVAEGATEGLLALHSLSGFRDAIFKRRESEKVASLTPPQLVWLAVWELDVEVNNGGFAQYFFNSGGDDWEHAIDGLRTVEAKERQAIFQEALSRFQPEPSKNRSQRQRQLAKLARKIDDPFHDLDDRYFASKEIIEVALTKYVIQNAAAFR